MSKHLQRDLERIERGILEIGALVEQSIHKAIAAHIAGRPELVQEVLALDEEIDRREVELEEDCLKLLALHQPVAVDLRYIVATIKVNSTLERMGDHACNIARAARTISRLTNGSGGDELSSIADKVTEMVRLCLNALVKMDVDAAREVLSKDDEVDDANHAICDRLAEEMTTDPRMVHRGIETMLASRHLERIADLTTNVSEDVLFMVEGEIVRHGINLEE
jgi:phosphate transport system protein